jgi:hypothetical protein
VRRRSKVVDAVVRRELLTVLATVPPAVPSGIRSSVGREGIVAAGTAPAGVAAMLGFAVGLALADVLEVADTGSPLGTIDNGADVIADCPVVPPGRRTARGGEPGRRRKLLDLNPVVLAPAPGKLPKRGSSSTLERLLRGLGLRAASRASSLSSMPVRRPLASGLVTGCARAWTASTARSATAPAGTNRAVDTRRRTTNTSRPREARLYG